MATVVPTLDSPGQPPAVTQPTDRWEDRHAGIGGAINLTTEEYLAVHGAADDGSSPPIWAVLAALLFLPVTCYPVLTAAVGVIAVLSALVAWWAGVVAAVGVVVMLAVWRRWHRRSFVWFVGGRLSRWRRRQMYRRRWAVAWDRAGLGCRFDAVSPRRHRPRLLRLTADQGIDHLHIELLPRQRASDVAARLADLAASFGQSSGWVTLDRPASSSYRERIILHFTDRRAGDADTTVVLSEPVTVRLDHPSQAPPPASAALEPNPVPELVESAGGER